MKSNRIFKAFMVALLLAAASGTAWANDKIISSVTIPAGQPVPIITPNGVAQGVIRLDYTWTTSTCTTGAFAQFNLGLEDQLGTGQGGVYPADLSLSGSGGGTPVQLSPSPSNLTVSGRDGLTVRS